MLFQLLLPSLLAVVAVAVPIADTEEHVEVVRYKRDTILEARDIELADTHGVDLNEMYKHSLLKRDDGDHITVWVDRRFVDHEDEVEDEESLSKRQVDLRLANNAGFESSVFSDQCHHHKRQDHTGPNGPTTGGVKAIYQWARAHRGGVFRVSSSTSWQNLVIAGSNGGTNALYRARTTSSSASNIGTQDVRNDADWTQNKARSFNGKWRASSKGGETCSSGVRINYELIKTKYNV